MQPSAVIAMDVLGFLLIGPFILANFFLRPGGIDIVPADGLDTHKPLPTMKSSTENSWWSVCLGVIVVVS
jgi:hypothetical protein